jgi:phosphoglycolate phosphatase-like HAD superfamily hydrolase
MEEIVFLSDNDGTLFNSFPLYDMALEHTFGKYFIDGMNLPALRTQLRELPPGGSWFHLLATAREILAIEDASLEQLVEDYLDYFLRVFPSREDFIYPHTLPLLDALETRRIPLVIQSGASRRMLRPVYEHFDLADRISGMVCGDDFISSNKHIIIAHAAGMVPSRKYVVFGDSPMDIVAGADYGFKTVHIRTESDWESHRTLDILPDHVFTGDVAELMEFLDSLR